MNMNNNVKYIKKFNPKFSRALDIVIYPETIKQLDNGTYTCTAYWGGDQVTDPELLDSVSKQIKGITN